MKMYMDGGLGLRKGSVDSLFPYVALGFVILVILIVIFFPVRKKMDLRTLSWIMSDGGKQPFELTGIDKDGNEVLTVKYQPPPEEET